METISCWGKKQKTLCAPQIPNYIPRDDSCFDFSPKAFLSQSTLVAGPTHLLVNGHWGRFPTCVKRPGCEAENLTPTSAEIMNACYIYTLQHAFTVYITLTLPTLKPNPGLRGDKLAANRPHYSTVKREKLV